MNQIQLTKPHDEKEALTYLTHAVNEVTQALGKIHEQLKVLNATLAKRDPTK
jgi:hypothetical protein